MQKAIWSARHKCTTSKVQFNNLYLQRKIMKKIIIAAFLFTFVPLCSASAQNYPAQYNNNGNHGNTSVDPNAWRRNDNYMNNGSSVQSIPNPNQQNQVYIENGRIVNRGNANVQPRTNSPANNYGYGYGDAQSSNRSNYDQRRENNNYNGQNLSDSQRRRIEQAQRDYNERIRHNNGQYGQQGVVIQNTINNSTANTSGNATVTPPASTTMTTP